MVQGRKLNLDKNQLYNLYEVQKKSMNQTAKILGCSPWPLRAYLCKYGFRIRSRAEALDKNHGRYKHKDGYIAIRKLKHPNASKNCYIIEHIFIMA